MNTLSAIITGIASAGLTVLYWELRALAAKARTQALRDEVDTIPERTAQAVAEKVTK